jgi:hypothetical protein
MQNDILCGSATTHQNVLICVGLCRLRQSAVDSLVQILSLPGFGIATVVYAHQPGARATSDDLGGLAAIEYTSGESRHTKGIQGRAMKLK